MSKGTNQIKPQTNSDKMSALRLPKSMGYFAVDLSFNCSIWNTKMCDITGIGNDKVLGQNIIEKFPLFYSSELFTRIDSVYKNQLNDEFVLIDKNCWSNSNSYFSYTVIPETKNNGEIIGCHIICQEPVLNNLNYNNSLTTIKEKNEPYFIIFEKLTIPSVISRYGIIQHANKAFLNLVGLENNEELVGTKISNFISSSYKEELRAITIDRYNGKEIKFPILIEFIKKDSSTITCETNISFIELPDGLASVVSMQDVSEKIKIQNALIESEAKFRQMFDTTFVGIMLLNDNGFISEANNRFLEIIGYSSEEFNKQPMHWEQFTPVEYLEYDYQIENQVLTQGYFNPYEKEFYRKDGIRVPILITGCFVKGESKNLGAAFIIDLTELKKSKEETSKVVNELSTFLYMASHDLKGPVATVKGLTQYALNQVQDATSQYYFNLINECTQKLDKSLVNFLKIVKIKNIIFKNTPIDFNKIIQETITDYRHLVDIDLLSISIKIADISEFFSDEDLIKTIFHNLIENSVKYSVKTRKTFIQISIDKTEDGIIIRVEDNGKGIDEKIMNKIFSLFFRGDSESTGSGLGLYIVKSATENLNGNVSVSNKPEGGAIFEIRLPFLNDEIGTQY